MSKTTNKTIIYITDSVLNEEIARACRTQLVKVAGDIPIISVSQKPLDLGLNINMGDIGRSWYNIYVQQLEGLKQATTEFVMIAEHDVMYTKEHIDWIPPDNKTFWYNTNCWFVQWGGNHPELNGMYSFWNDDRKALSQLVCDRKLLIESIEDRMFFLEGGLRILKRLGEPGAFPPEVVEAARIAVSGECKYLQPYLEKHLAKFTCNTFRTKQPNLDIRHSSNFTGPRRGKHRRYELEPWGRFQTVMENSSC